MPGPDRREGSIEDALVPLDHALEATASATHDVCNRTVERSKQRLADEGPRIAAILVEERTPEHSQHGDGAYQQTLEPPPNPTI